MLSHLASAPNVNHLWAGLLVEELVRQGTTFFVVCPGSRSTPLAVAVGQNPRAEALVHWDERAAAFVALGWGRATGRPAAVITTSGTAVANLLPAAVEADADGVPMLLLTADRPPELRETGANQAVRQPPIFQDVARWSLDWPVPTADVPARWVLSTAAHAAHRATAPPGPVHLNLPFREPLGAQPDGTDAAAYLGGVGRWGSGLLSQRFTEPVGRVWPGGQPQTEFDQLAKRLRSVERGVVVAGYGASLDADDVAWRLGWPLLADLRSPGLRVGASHWERPVPYADLVLTSESFRRRGPAEAVVHLGGRLVSKRLGQYLRESEPATYVLVGPERDRTDADALVTHRVDLGEGEALPVWPFGPRQESTRWQQTWGRASAAVGEVLERVIGGASGLSEPAVARSVSRQTGLPEGDRPFVSLVASASMPVRDLESYAVTDRGPEVMAVANRGASGIDGTVATAAGYVRGRGGAAVLLTGDLALLHDQTSLALLRTGPPVVVVVINNDGGGIFHRLPVAAGGVGELDSDTFERFFGTPHGLGFEDAARQVGLAYHRPETMPAFEAALDGAVRSGASALIEVRTDREEQAALRRRIEAAAAAAVDAALAGDDT
ncbi:2-succinyl-5-enolpyruvyl-6-hydroxy-3-cyclohexene-1-carboxylic-acid synthase [Rubrivirga sp. S365]|uniref:2-succinyl-5-enolpyruvyl-6-hydroxy-3-cyclohexene-1-carboxylate synthase n=1 Tax=Rubrivirga litoralis TaxID=3075598 RepID=A0ABU3BUK7_9BACT|nr:MULTISPECIES: 2-succinyl-5-enolpyruvyl-6-hydroxy-3-cyclohexene-1-carboxylic-acid synthase [unclassified Rubrivirga]MDT0632962.1 2-succinyl-5-enolpyruvyl-6-hydroxy-3-cyclohexene-1-carboxylic-acid synthase [Rubrivirga sp. F394]MDT7856237.1 2-succinyl-5-enolpyruvyl-6-hydroxy-3-cyclohexene-1-carboxylic-acid synthase [Rubrivirga sp. S365]